MLGRFVRDDGTVFSDVGGKQKFSTTHGGSGVRCRNPFRGERHDPATNSADVEKDPKRSSRMISEALIGGDISALEIISFKNILS